jgi:transcriptional regulator with AAA-type ATPase domain
LAAFKANKATLDRHNIFAGPLDQAEMEEEFNHGIGFKFDHVYYLYPGQEVQDKIKTHRPHKKDVFIDTDRVILNSPTLKYWKECLDLEMSGKLDQGGLKGELSWFENKLGATDPKILKKIRKEYWRNIHHYSIEDQVHWFWKMSNVLRGYQQRSFSLIDMTSEYGISDMRDYLGIAKGVSRFLSDKMSKHQDDEIIINISLGSYETQVVWFLLAENGQLPPRTRFISTYDHKDDEKHDRFKDFYIREVPVQLIRELKSEISFFPETQSAPRKLADLKIKSYLNSGFSILLLGPRGTGKTRMVQENSKNLGGRFISANCASFADDTMAESELFGHKKGAFVGARTNSEGLFGAANGGILFLDEIHHLSKRVQAKLMTALQTKSDNQFEIRRLGDAKAINVECRVIMASNRGVHDLKEVLLPDFFDRIAQQIIDIPSLSMTPEDRVEDWKAVWKQMLFKGQSKPPLEKELLDWLKRQELPGNFRDLQKIAIHYHAFLEYDDQIKAMIPEQTPFEFAKSEYTKYHQSALDSPSFKFSRSKTSAQMIAEFKKSLATWVEGEYGGKTQAAKHFQDLGEKTTRQTIDNWSKG